MISVITLNVTVCSPHTRYECYFLNIKQVQYQICEKFMGGRMGGRHGCDDTSQYQNLDFDMKIWHWCISSRPWRPPIMHCTFFTYLMLYLFDIKKITFVSHVGDSNGHAKRNTKNHRFLVFRPYFWAFSDDPRCSKQLKIVQECICKCKNTNNYRESIIFYSGEWWYGVFRNFASHIMGGGWGGATVGCSNGYPTPKTVFFGLKRLYRCSWRPPPSPPHVCRKSPPHPPPFQRPTFRPPWSPPCSIENMMFSRKWDISLS